MKFCDPNEKNFSSSPGLTPQKRGSYARRYVRVMHNFFEIFKSPSKSAKKVLKSIDFRTFCEDRTIEMFLRFRCLDLNTRHNHSTSLRFCFQGCLQRHLDFRAADKDHLDFLF